jgi:hypothetical protein
MGLGIVLLALLIKISLADCTFLPYSHPLKQKLLENSWIWGCTSIIPALSRLRQEALVQGQPGIQSECKVSCNSEILSQN